MSVRAKFFVSAIKHHSYGSGDPMTSITLTPVTPGSDEDKAFWKATPSGQIELGVMNPAAATQFELGKKYFVDFTPAE